MVDYDNDPLMIPLGAEARSVIGPELMRLRAMEDRANRIIARIPDPDWVKAARFILDGKSGPMDSGGI